MIDKLSIYKDEDGDFVIISSNFNMGATPILGGRGASRKMINHIEKYYFGNRFVSHGGRISGPDITHDEIAEFVHEAITLDPDSEISRSVRILPRGLSPASYNLAVEGATQAIKANLGNRLCVVVAVSDTMEGYRMIVGKDVVGPAAAEVRAHNMRANHPDAEVYIVSIPLMLGSMADINLFNDGY